MKQRLPVSIPADLSVLAVVGGADTYQGDTTIYDSAGATGTITGGMVQSGDTIYDSAGATGSVSGATLLPPEAQR